MKFNAGVTLTDEEARQVTEASCEIYPMKWVDTDKNAYSRREVTIMSLFLQRTKVDWLAVEILRRQMDFAQILQLVMWFRTVLFAIGVHKLTSPFTHATLRMDTSKDKKSIEYCCIVFQLKLSQKKE